MASLAEVLDQFQGEGERQSVAAPDGWGQGRTLYGGMTVALCHHAMRRALGDLPPVRSVQVNFTGPATEQLDFQVTRLRQGKNSAVIQVTCTSPAGPAALAIFTCANARDSAVTHDDMPMPQVPAPEDCAPLHDPDRPKPGFFNHFDMQFVRGGRPRSGADPDLLIWSRLRDDDGRADPLTVLLALGDALPPAAMALMPKWAPISSMTWNVELPGAVTSRGWHLLHSVSEQAAGGYSLQSMNLWTDQGHRIMASRQLVAIFG